MAEEEVRNGCSCGSCVNDDDSRMPALQDSENESDTVAMTRSFEVHQNDLLHIECVLIILYLFFKIQRLSIKICIL